MGPRFPHRTTRRATAITLGGLLLTAGGPVWGETSNAVPTGNRNTVAAIEFLGQAVVPTGFEFQGTVVGGLSGIAYDNETGAYLALSDDRVGARLYGLEIDLTDGALADGDVTFTSVTSLLDAAGQPYAPLTLDPEGLALSTDGTVFVSSEGDVVRGFPPFVNEYRLDGSLVRELPVPDQFLPSSDGSRGPRNNLVFESLTFTPDETVLYTATENALIQDGPAATVGTGSPSRVVAYRDGGRSSRQYVYVTEPVAAAPVPEGGFATNGLVELLALDNEGSLLALERSFSAGVGNAVSLYQSYASGVVDVSALDGINGLEADPSLPKELLLDFADLGLTLDNLEAMTFGPALADGRPTLIVVSDNNFSATQFTQFLAFALDIEPIPLARPAKETPPVLDDLPDLPAGRRGGDSDDPAIWVHPGRPSDSVVIGTLKEGGLQITDLRGRLVQRILPRGASYNNVDIVYGFPISPRRTIDLAIASDRANDTVALFSIDSSGRLTPIRRATVPESIFGVDDGEATAYGLATYVSPDSGRTFVFVTQASGNQIAQLEISPGPAGRIEVTEVRRLEAPVDGDPEDAQTEGVVADPDQGIVYVAMEDGAGILEFGAEPDDPTGFTLFYDAADDLLVPDIEGLDLYLGPGTSGHLIASSQGDSTFHVWERDGSRAYLGRFGVGSAGRIDAVDESDGLDIVSAPLGSRYPEGLMVVHDGQDESQLLNVDGDEIENAATNFVYVSWAEVARTIGLDIDPSRAAR